MLEKQFSLFEKASNVEFNNKKCRIIYIKRINPLTRYLRVFNHVAATFFNLIPYTLYLVDVQLRLQ